MMNKTDEYYEVHLGSDSQPRATYALRRQISQSEKLRHNIHPRVHFMGRSPSASSHKGVRFVYWVHDLSR